MNSEDRENEIHDIKINYADDEEMGEQEIIAKTQEKDNAEQELQTYSEIKTADSSDQTSYTQLQRLKAEFAN